ncbi:hypothetical protein RYX36_023723 [Vicia faba]
MIDLKYIWVLISINRHILTTSKTQSSSNCQQLTYPNRPLHTRANLSKKLSVLSPEELRDLVCCKLKLVSKEDPWTERVDFLIEIMVSFFEKQQSQKEAINALPLYPNEQIMWDESVVPSINYSGEGCLALPKLNLQFLTLHDYLLRNFNLFRLELTYEIREDIQEVVPHLLAYINIDGETAFRGEVKPSSVTAEVTYSISSYRSHIRSEWDALKEHDVLFLLTIRPSFEPLSAEEENKASVPQKLGLQYVRGCEVIEIRDEEGTLMNDFSGKIKREGLVSHWHFSSRCRLWFPTCISMLPAITGMEPPSSVKRRTGLIGLPCCRIYLRRLLDELTPPRNSGRAVKRSSLAPAFVNGGGMSHGRPYEHH